MKKKVWITVMILIIISFFVFLGNRPIELQASTDYHGSIYTSATSKELSYDKYRVLKEGDHPDQIITVDAVSGYDYQNGLFEEEAVPVLYDEQEGLYIPETGDVSWNVMIPATGFYNIKIEYYPISGRSSNITRGLKIDNAYPFLEAESFVLFRVWKDAYPVSEKRTEGKHDLRPSQEDKPGWYTSPIKDVDGYYNGKAYDFYLTEGNRKITLVGNKEPVAIKTITIYQETPDATYDQKKAEYEANGYEIIGSASFSEDGYAKVQGEESYEKSSPILAPVANWSSYKIDPYEKFITRYNTIGGVGWRVSGDWISWKINVPRTGLYRLTFTVLQDYKRGMFSSRILSINGKVPFQECRDIQFAYSSDWQNVTIGNEQEPYLFYLPEGINTITLEATIGIYADVVRITEETIATLNTLYRKVVMIAGVNPDKYQDYMLEERIDGLYEMINSSITQLSTCINRIIDIAGERSSLISSFERTLYQMKKFMENEQNIQEGLNELDDNIASLGTWVMTISEQPLLIDSLYLHGSDSVLPKPKTNFFEKLWHEIVMLFGSYGANTSLESSIETDGPTITVWISSGRDQSQLFRQLIDDSFTAQHGINVKLKLVSQSALLPATLSGNGPDVAIGVSQNIPVNWGIRNALLDLTQFPDFSLASSQFHESAITPFRFQNAVYALPDTQDFLIGFVRTDILEELQLEVPETWDEVLGILPTLQRQYLDYYLPNTKGALSTLMYAMINQNGGKLYAQDGSKTLLTEENATRAFIDFTSFFSDYGFEIDASFSNRFRSGEMPIGVYNFSLYNTLSVFAPEIRGQWKFAPLPGYAVQNTVANQTTSTVSGSVILSSTKEKEASWEFLQWWLSEEAQSEYARGMEAILGPGARYPTANLKAFASLPWSAEEYRILSAQREKAVGVPTFPGDYIVGRYIDNAFRAVINENINPRDSLYEYTEKINIELTRKRKEFHLE